MSETVEKRDYEKEAVIKAKEAAKALTDLVNAYSYKQREFVDEITNSHRTLQQSTGELFFMVIQRWAKMYEDGWIDARNETICKMSAEINQFMTENYDKNWHKMPFI